MSRPRGRALAALSIGALGVVYGDIGTSPLYAFKECVSGPHAVAVTPANVYGILSLIFWALVLVVAVKYLTFIMRADNDGEGGILALFALLLPRRAAAGPGHRRGPVLLLGLLGAGLLVAEGMITPPISVLGAMEGIEVRQPSLAPVVVPAAIGILLLLFLGQRHGSGRIGRVFGPLMIVWFATIAVAGAIAVADHPQVLAAVNPVWAVRLFASHGWLAFFLLGAVVLVVTGSEALYADMGHFGRAPIRTAWFAVVMPALLLNYFGQGAIVLERPETATNPFYGLTPGWTLYPMLGLATAAAVIASQALISGVYSLVRQAVQLGYFPRVRVVHTSATEGQIYIPEINWLLLAGCLAIVVGFGSASALAAAYGIAVTGVMTMTSVLFDIYARRTLGWPAWRAHALAAAFLVIDVSLLAANAGKVASGGWLPLVVGVALYTVMLTWNRGRHELHKATAEAALPLELFVADVAQSKPTRVPGTGVFMTATSAGAPTVLLHFIKHAKVLHEQVVLLSIQAERVPKVAARDRVDVTPLGEGIFQVIARVGFQQDPDVPALLAQCRRHGLRFDPGSTSYFLGRETLLTTGRAPMARWRKKLFAFLSLNSRSPAHFFHLPPNRVVELGAQIQL